MESKRFDELTKSVASAASRRSVIKGILGGAVASISTAIGLRGADAAQVKRGLNQICRKDGECADGYSCEPAGYGRSRCCVEGSVICNDSCCRAICDSRSGCVDSQVDLACWESCVGSFCSGINQTFNGAEQCKQFCAYVECSIGPQ